jgi:Xaa-Pro aminopeptidase
MNQKSESNRLTDIRERLLNRAAHAVIIKDKPNLYYDAAYEIEKQAKRIAELEAALKPFADEAQFFVTKALDNHLAAPDRLYLTIGQFRAARKVLGEKE